MWLVAAILDIITPSVIKYVDPLFSLLSSAPHLLPSPLSIWLHIKYSV